MIGDLLDAVAVDQGHPPRFIVGVQDIEQLLDEGREFVHRKVGTDLDAEGVADATEELHVGVVDVRRPHADPRIVGGEVVPPLASRNLSGQCRLVRQQQSLVTREEVDA